MACSPASICNMCNTTTCLQFTIRSFAMHDQASYPGQFTIMPPGRNASNGARCRHHQEYRGPICHHHIRQSTIPPILRSAHSLTSRTPRSVLTAIISPTCVRGLISPLYASRPLVRSPSSFAFSHMRLVGFDNNCAFRNTGSPSQYFNPSHNLREARLACVTTPSVSRPHGSWDSGAGGGLKG